MYYYMKLSRFIPLLVTAFLLSGCFHESLRPQPNATQAPESELTPAQAPTTQAPQFTNPKKSAHYESITPVHAAILAAPPVNVVIDFNFDLVQGSSISITTNNQEYGLGETTIDTNKLSLRRAVSPSAPDGVYTVTYKACWPDGSCHDGSFEFAIDRSQSATYQDLTNQKTVNINLRQIAFQPAKIKVKSGTTVTWTNADTVDHYINTDSHPAHTYYPTQNSHVLTPGATYSLTFTTPGEYPYHCSAHAASMTGSILVEST